MSPAESEQSPPPKPASGHGFPRAARVLHGRDFKTVRAARRSVSDDVLTVGWCPNQAGRARLGMAVTIRGLGAVGRNRIRRLLREAFRRLAPTITHAIDLVVTPRNNTLAQDAARVSASLARLVERIAKAEARR